MTVLSALPRLAAAALALVVLRACASATPPPPAELPPLLAAMVEAARQDAARSSGIAAERWQLLRAEAVTWSDGSLGCPQPGRGYTQALVPGYLVQLRADGLQRDYHAGASGAARYCPPDRARPPLPADAAR